MGKCTNAKCHTTRENAAMKIRQTIAASAIALTTFGVSAAFLGTASVAFLCLSAAMQPATAFAAIIKDFN